VRNTNKKDPKSDDEGEGEGDNTVGSLYGAGQFCKINWVQTSSGRGRLVPHHEWDGWGFIRKEPQRHPEVKVKVSVCREAYKQLGIKEPR
jgi:hypothetical protein